MTDPLSLDAVGQLHALQSKQISAVELLEASVAREAAVHGRINAVVAADPERAVHAARAIDDLRFRGEQTGLLAGLPMTIKDTLDVQGLPASSGLVALKGRTAVDAAAVAHARAQGAVIWGKTNVPVMAADWQSYNDVYGQTNNPWDVARTCGGSAGGAAAALATGVTPLEIGSDLGGSLRTPAHFCGVYALTPTSGLVSQRGHVPPQPGAFAEADLNVIGPMARSARDLRLLLAVMENGPLAARAPAADLAELKVGLWLEEPGFLLDGAVRAPIEAFAARLEAAGAAVTPIRSPVNGQELLDAYGLLLTSVIGADLPARTRSSLGWMRGPAKLARARGAGPLSWAATVLGYTASHRDWLAANETRARHQHQIAEVFQRFDVLIAPIAPVAAFPHDHRPFNKRKLAAGDRRTFPYVSMLQWIALATACGLPATAIPAGRTDAGLPVGAQIIGPRGADGRTLAVAQAIEERLGGFIAPPLPEITVEPAAEPEPAPVGV